ncbi:MAG TPA: hypothetical protein VHI52_22935 [Verrucomicrobiae bacterium]|jgi:hypothetical protein|nr:hypothetical protein [Verrucomicrobiae bacterium]
MTISILASSFVVLMCSSAIAGTIYSAPTLHALIFDGALSTGDADKLKAAFEASPEKPTALFINSPGGDFYTAMAAGNWVRSMGLDTYAGLLCESACAYLWLGGVHKYANEMVGIHAPYVRTSQMTVAVPAEGLVDATWYLAKLGYDRALVDAIFAVGTTESDESFPITGPETHYLGIRYGNYVDQPFKDELTRLRSAHASE